MNLGTRGFWVVVFITHLLDKAGCRENNNMERSRNSRRGVRVCVCVCVCVSQWQKQAGTTGAVIPVHLPMVLRGPQALPLLRGRKGKGYWPDLTDGKTES